MANEWAKHGITVNAIAPGYMATNNTALLRSDEARTKEILDASQAGAGAFRRISPGPVVFRPTCRQKETYQAEDEEMATFKSTRRIALGVLVAAAIEALRAAMVSGDGRALAAMVADDLTYGHSNGRLENKGQFLASLGGKNPFKSIDLTKQTVTVDGDVAVVRHVFDGVNNLPDGKTSAAHIAVLQV